MKQLLSILILTGLFFQVGELQAQKTSINDIVGLWQGTLENGGKSREIDLIFELDHQNKLKCHWSILETGIDEVPLVNVVYDEISGQIDINKKFITGRFSSNQLTGNLDAHGFKGKLQLKKSQSTRPDQKEKILEFQNGEVTLAGRLIVPEGEGPFPALVFIHGSGPGLSSDWNYAARRLSKLGIACLVYDKRGSGKSTGNWVTSSLRDLGMDVSKIVDVLGQMPEIDANRIGLWGHSQGGWVGPLASKLSSQIGFQVMVSGGGITPRDSEMYSYLKNLEYGNFNEKVYSEVRSLVNLYFEYMSTGKDREELVQRIEKAKSEPWYNYINIHRVLVSETNRKNWSWVADYDPVQDIAELKEPILVIYGGEDIIQDKGLSISAWLKGLKMAQNTNYDLKVFPLGNHGLRIGDHDSGPVFWQDFVDGYWSTAEDWLRKNVLKSED